LSLDGEGKPGVFPLLDTWKNIEIEKKYSKYYRKLKVKNILLS
jgi:hypothetical protein